ncbi:MAG: NYN domain-containing protein [Solirubrobacterales bacterium]
MRTIVYVDGFNLYYGACRAPGRKWLDLGALCARLLPNDEIVQIAYCTANLRKDPRHPALQDQQRLYHRALQTISHLEIYGGRFSSKQVTGTLVDPAPGERPWRTITTFEEKGTDVNIASLMLKDGYEGRYEQAALITNDSDLKMPVEIVRTQLCLPVVVINPILRKRGRRRNKALSPDPLPPNASFIQLRAKQVEESQFPAQIRSRQGATLVKPADW